MGRTTKALGFSVPPAVVNRAQRDHDDDQWLGDLIEEAKAEQAHSPTDVEGRCILRR